MSGEPTEDTLVQALRHLAQHGDLLDFPCPDDEVPAINVALARRGLTHIRRSRVALTDAGTAFLAKRP